ncbi:hypothetical protein BO94DRAFT_572005 [Aspergillus sclerotioniger CBS 115572]|uniref:Uncharacterized protein n=1 Tax=Aspergillus sclerotioniger CBS 115572 TaxID=1450535 RepID=A0A317XBF3_9EURO|nr:hypothetical protein BO94DRAFT_572005 [Aspergillus sclerotioniger CBS 115572]PWY95441.1 hypothetical protein BO94DRAFT_572005 [Aspergillus sclerotioniger CBS 115572]
MPSSPPSLIPLPLLLLYLTLPTAATTTTCYDPTGTKLHAGYQPCPPSSGSPNSCCNIGNGDLCTDSGLCLRQDTLANGFWYQDGCTDRDWRGCRRICSGKIVLCP